MLSKNRIKQIVSLQQKKFRTESSSFIAEGSKVVLELLRSNIKIREIFAIDTWVSQHAHKFKNVTITVITEDDMKRISALQTPTDVLAEVEMFPTNSNNTIHTDQLYLGLDSIRDPGNFGTILRIANWYGISTIYASHDCVDIYNPKVIQASMGSAFRTEVRYCNLPDVLAQMRLMQLPIYGTFLNGNNIYTSTLSNNGIIVLGNEGHGILPDTEKQVTHRLLIPTGAPTSTMPESLNVATATAIVCSEFFRRRYTKQ